MDNLALSILSELLRTPATANYANDIISRLPDNLRDRLFDRLMRLPNISHEEAAFGSNGYNPFLDAETILKTDWPEPIWIIPGVIPTGLVLLGGAPKLGKSWMALQFSLAVACGGYTFGKRIDQGNVLYMALEDPPRRLKERMLRQSWPMNAAAEFLTVGKYKEIIGDVRGAGGDRLASYILRYGYRLVVIDTASRAIDGDQNDVAQMTVWFTPLQEIAQEMNCCILMLDHHNKLGSADAVRDVLGSTAKAAMADTVIGVYRERGKPDARLTITGRDVEEQTLNIRFDRLTGSWQLDSNPLAGLTADQADLIIALEGIQPATPRQIAEALGKEYEKAKGSIFNRLATLQIKNRVIREGETWSVAKD